MLDVPATRLDTGAGLTNIPTSLADELGIAYSNGSTIEVTGATGKGTGYLGSIVCGFECVPGFEFQFDCIFNPNVPCPLLSLRDVVANFDVGTKRPSRKHVYGAFVLRLRRDHLGTPIEAP